MDSSLRVLKKSLIKQNRYEVIPTVYMYVCIIYIADNVVLVHLQFVIVREEVRDEQIEPSVGNAIGIDRWLWMWMMRECKTTNYCY